MADQGAVELLEEATAALGEASSEIRVGLLSGLARALDFQGDHERAEVVRTSAIDMARRSGDRAGLATVLMRAYWSRGKNSLEEILAMLTEAAAIGEELGNTEIRAEALSWRVPTFVALGDIDAARREVTPCRRRPSRPRSRSCSTSPRTTARRWRSATAASTTPRRSPALTRLERLLTGREASGVHGIQMFGIRREQGRLAELAPVIRLLAGQPGSSGPWRPGFVSVLVELGMDTAARQELEQVRTDGLDSLRESLWLASLTYLTDACAALGDEETAALVYPELEPLAGPT